MGAGADSSVLYVSCAIAMLLVGVVSRSLYKRAVGKKGMNAKRHARRKHFTAA
ncbi:hypothetical protein S7335_3877 [Synechococcus sp. PCC 7335]|nr:hypothetical protein S7335_3877 [Synechococcus sp. PCC 7335]